MVLIIILSAGCAPKQTIIQAPVQPEPGDQLFQDAEKMFNRADYEAAHDAYKTFIDRYPDSLSAAAAIMKLGEIYAIQGKSDESRRMYECLISNYPDSLFSNDARVNILESLYEEGRYQDVIRQAAIALEDSVSEKHIIRIYSLLGDTYQAKELYVDAANFYLSAYHRTAKQGKTLILVKLKNVFWRLKTLDIISLLSRMKDDALLESYLMYHLGHNYAEEGKNDKAVRVLSDFLKQFPKHEYAEQAAGMITELNLRSVYRRDTIGCLLPLSGPYEIYGQRALKGVELALSVLLNAHGDFPLNLIIRDTASDSEKAIETVKQFADEHVAAIIGPVIAAEAAAGEAQRQGIPIVTLTQKRGITQTGDYVFRHFITPEMQVDALVNYCISDLGIKRFTMLYPEEPYGIAFMNLFWDRVISAGGEVTGVESYQSSQTDFADSIKKLAGLFYKLPEALKPDPEDFTEEALPEPLNKSAGPDEDEETVQPGALSGSEETKPVIDFDAIFIPDSPKKAGLIIPQLAFYDITDVYLLGTNLWHSGQLIQMAGQYAQKAILPDGFFADSSSAETRKFVSLFREVYGEEPGFMEAIAYDTTMMLFDMVRNPEIQSRKQLRDQLADMKAVDGVTGSTSFDQSGEAVKQLYLLRIKGNKFIELNRR
ncbi:MAG: penicillin-binding protein activator [Desulfobacterales bacterium]|nr:penicillin-binding protein activator [Desulfobacterales bacterium]